MSTEYNAVVKLTPANVQKRAPLIYQQLVDDAEADEETVDEYLAGLSFQEFLDELIRWCHKEMWDLEKKVERYPAVVAMVETARDELSIPWGKIDVFNKYQAALDNQLFMTLKALRDAQAWRVDSLDSETVPVAPGTESGAA